MTIKKNPKYDLKLQWKKLFEISLIISLTIVIVAFKFYPNFEKEEKQVIEIQEELKVEDIVRIRENDTPPPPPKPPLPIEAASDDVLDELDVSVFEVAIDDVIKTPPPLIERKVEVEEEVVEFIPTPEEMPEPIGGIASIQSKITYPELAKRAGVSGRVSVRAYIDEKGTVAKVELVKGIGAGCDEEALKAVSLTKFKPGKQRMKPVRTQVVVPVIFRLQ